MDAYTILGIKRPKDDNSNPISAPVQSLQNAVFNQQRAPQGMQIQQPQGIRIIQPNQNMGMQNLSQNSQSAQIKLPILANAKQNALKIQQQNNQLIAPKPIDLNKQPKDTAPFQNNTIGNVNQLLNIKQQTQIAPATQTQSDQNISNFFKPFGALIKGAVTYPITLGKDVLDVSRGSLKSAGISLAAGPASLTPGGADASKQALQQQNAQNDAYTQKLIKDAVLFPRGIAASVAGIVPTTIESVKTIAGSPQKTPQPVVSKNPITKFFVGDQPIESVQQAYEQGGPTQAGKAGSAGADIVNKILSVLVLKGAIKPSEASDIAAQNKETETSTGRNNPLGPKVETPQVGKTDPLTSLKQEALKYKSADEFIKANTDSYHGGAAKHETFINGNGIDGQGVYTTTDAARAKMYGTTDVNGNVREPVVQKVRTGVINPLDENKTYVRADFPQQNPQLDKVFDYYKDGVNGTNLAIQLRGKDGSNEIAKQLGFDGIKKGKDIIAFYPEKLMSEKQLTDLYNQAHAEAKPSAPQVGKTDLTTSNITTDFGKRVNNLPADTAAQEVLGRGGTVDEAARAYEQIAPQTPKDVVDSEVSALVEHTTPRFDPTQFDQKANPDLVNKAENYDEVINNKLDASTDTKNPLQDLLNRANGKYQEGVRTAREIGKAIRAVVKNKSELQDIRDYMEGAKDASEVSEDVIRVANVLRPLNDKVLVIGKHDNPELGEREDYGTRQILKSFEPGDKTQSLRTRGFNKLSDLFRKDSSVTARTQIFKFVDDNGNTKFGKMGELGFTRTDINTFEDKNGTQWHAEKTNASEIEASGRANYRKDMSKIATNHLIEGARVRARQLALEEILRDPERYNIRDAENAKPRDVAIHNVPELFNKVTDRKTAKLLDDSFKETKDISPFRQGFRTASRAVIQTIIINPAIHTFNLLNQAIVATGAGREDLGMSQKVFNGFASTYHFGKTLVKLSDPEIRQAIVKDYLRNGGHFDTYGAESDTILTRALESMNLPEFNKWNAKAMESIDTAFRLAAHLANKEAGMLPKESIKVIDNFMGENTKVPELAQDIGLFYKWTRTTFKALYSQVRHPGRYMGSTVALGVAAAIYYGLNAGLQKSTGNRYASFHTPGELGTIKELARIVKNPSSGIKEFISSKTNPIITAALDQLFGQNLYSGNKLDTTSKRLKDLYTSVFAPAKDITKITSGKQTVASGFVLPEVGVNLPVGSQAPGKAPYQAAPNAKGLFNTLLNVPGSTGGTGVAQQKTYYAALDAMTKALAGDNNKLARDAVNAYMDKDINAQGKKVDHDPQESVGIANLLAGNAKALAALQQFEQASGNKDPMWKLSPKDLKTFLNYEGTRTTDPTKQAIPIVNKDFNNGEGFSQFLKDRSNYFSQNKFVSTSVPSPSTPTYPKFKGQQQNDYFTYESVYKNMPSAQKAAFLQSHPDAVDALNQISKYYNNLGVAQGGLAIKDSLKLTSDQQAALNAYDKLPSGTGARSAWIKANPELWNQITNVLAQNSVLSAAKAGAVEQYQGVPITSQYLKDISTAAQSIVKNPDGTFSINPAGAYAAKKASGKSSKSRRAPRVYRPKRIKTIKLKVKRPPKVRKVRLAKTKPIRIK